MIWQEHTHTIVMVTNLIEEKVKCQRYWPDTGSQNFGPFVVTITEKEMFADYIIRFLEVKVCSAHMAVYYFYTAMCYI